MQGLYRRNVDSETQRLCTLTSIKGMPIVRQREAAGKSRQEPASKERVTKRAGGHKNEADVGCGYT